VDGRKKTIVGDIEGSSFNLKYWLSCYLTLRGPGKDGDPFFVHEDGTVLTYQVVLDYMRFVFRPTQGKLMSDETHHPSCTEYIHTYMHFG